MLIEQRSQEWFDMRRGKITSSEIHKIMGGKGDSLSETAKTYLLEKACEFYGGHGNPATGAAVEWGMDLEDQAIEVYESKTKNKVDSIFDTTQITAPTTVLVGGGNKMNKFKNIKSNNKNIVNIKNIKQNSKNHAKNHSKTNINKQSCKNTKRNMKNNITKKNKT